MVEVVVVPLTDYLWNVVIESQLRAAFVYDTC
jgi:hypothetical protein